MPEYRKNPSLKKSPNACVACVPNFFTLCNALMGMAAIVNLLTFFLSGYKLSKRISYSAFITIFAVLFDGIDGLTARKLNVVSLKGAELDSLADLITSGAAPASLACAVVLVSGVRGPWMWACFAAAAVYFCCGALRLAEYNVRSITGSHKSGKKFSGLPIPGAAIAVAAAVLLLNVEQRLDLAAKTLTFVCLVTGILMVSPVPYPHMGKWLAVSLSDQRRLVVPAFYVLFIYLWRLERATSIMIALFLISGPITGIISLVRRRGRPKPETTVEPAVRKRRVRRRKFNRTK